MSGMVGRTSTPSSAEQGRQPLAERRLGSPAHSATCGSVTAFENSNRSATPGPSGRLVALDHRPVGLQASRPWMWRMAQ